jgi:hypothetical protein
MENNEPSIENDVHELLKVQDQLKVIAGKAKEARDPLKQRLEGLQERVKGYMSTRGLGEIEYGDTELLYKDTQRNNTLSRKSLQEALLSYFEGDEGNMQECFAGLMEHIGMREVGVLSRRVIKKPKEDATKTKPSLPSIVKKASAMRSDPNEAPPDLAADSDSD